MIVALCNISIVELTVKGLYYLATLFLALLLLVDKMYAITFVKDKKLRSVFFTFDPKFTKSAP